MKYDLSALRRHTGPVLSLVGLILLANLPSLTGLFDDNPMLFVSGLGKITLRGIWFGSPNWYDSNIGITVQSLGHLAAEDWLHGSVPWWNPYSGVGMPLAAELQNYALFLPFVLILHFKMGWLWLRVIFQIMAATFTYAFLIEIRLSRFAAILGGLMYGCTSTFILLANAPAATLAFIPLLLLGLEQARQAAIDKAAMGWSLITLAVCGSFYAGFPETAIFGNLLGGAWFVSRLFGMPKRAIARYGLKFLVSVALGLMLTGPGLLPFLEYLRLGEIGGHADSFANAHLDTVAIAVQILPMIFGPLGTLPVGLVSVRDTPLLQTISGSFDAGGGWFGALAILLGLVGVTVKCQTLRVVKWMLLLWFLFWEARIFGFLNISYFINRLPFFHLIAVFRYAEPSCDFVLIVLAAIGIDDWQREGAVTRGRILIVSTMFTALILLSIVLALPALHVLVSVFVFYRFFAIEYVSLVGLMVLFLICLLPRTPTIGLKFGFAAVIAINFVMGFGLSEAAGARKGKIDLAGVHFIQSHESLFRAYTLGPLQPNYGAEFSIAEINHNALPVPRIWTDFISENLDPLSDPILFTGSENGRFQGGPNAASELVRHESYYESIGVKFILATPGQNPFLGSTEPQTPPLVFQSSMMNVFQLPNPAPYFLTTPSDCSLRVENRLLLTADCSTQTILTRHELFYPGWHASVNGVSVSPSNTQAIFQSIPLPKGRSVIRFFYRPTHIRLACTVAGAGLIIWLAFGLAMLSPGRSRTI